MRAINTNIVVWLLIVYVNICLGQSISIPIKVSNNAGSSQLLYIGIDPSATDGIDQKLGEAALPPLPPNDIFDARLKLPTQTYDYSTKDFRYGSTPPFSSVISYSIEFQHGNSSWVLIEWEFPNEITALLKDKLGGIIINKQISGSGSFEITNLALNKLDLIVTYDLKTVSVRELELPNQITLYQNYPNPFNPETTISYELSAVSLVDLKVYDILGKELATLVNEMQQPGIYNVKFTGRQLKDNMGSNSSNSALTARWGKSSTLSNGIYIYMLRAGNFFSVKKMLLLK